MTSATSHTASNSIRLNRIEISTWLNEFAPNAERWSACLREYDLGTHVSTGATQRAAVNELLDFFEQDNGELHE